jgi:hypothetical protein
MGARGEANSLAVFENLSIGKWRALGQPEIPIKTERCAWWEPLKKRLKKGILKSGGSPRAKIDLVLDALYYRLRNAGPWRDLPAGPVRGRG